MDHENVEYVLDSSALLAAVWGEPGGDEVAEILGESAISAVNLAEALTLLARGGATPAEAIRLLSGLELAVVPWDFRHVEVSGRFAALAWTHGLSLGDRACLTLAAH